MRTDESRTAGHQRQARGRTSAGFAGFRCHHSLPFKSACSAYGLYIDAAPFASGEAPRRRPLMLPRALQQAIQEQAAAIPAPLLALASARQAELYSGADPDRAMRIESAAARLAYLAARMPPIFQVVQLLCAELARRYRRLEIHSVLDLGCGPATATLAAHECFEITSASLIDRDGEWFGIARRMLAAAGRKLAAGARFTAGDLDAAAAFEPHDLAIISYAIGE